MFIRAKKKCQGPRPKIRSPFLVAGTGLVRTVLCILQGLLRGSFFFFFHHPLFYFTRVWGCVVNDLRTIQYPNAS